MSELFQYQAQYRPPPEPMEPISPNPRRKSRRSASKREPDREDAEGEIERYKEAVLEGGDISDIPSQHLRPLIDQLQEQRNEQLHAGLVNDAEASDNAIHVATELLKSRAKLDAANARQQDINDRLAAARSDLQQLEEMVERQERNMHLQLQKKMIALEARQHEEVEDLTREWESPERARRYNRSSNQLRQLRTQAVLMLNSHRYDEMKVVERMADQLEADEAAAQHRQWENDFNVVLQKLLGRHQAERDKVQRAHSVKIGEYEAAKTFDLSVAQKRIQNLERELDEASDTDRVWNLHHRNDSIIRPKKTAGAAKRQIQVQDFNTLALPPLDEPKSSRMPPAAALAVQTYRQSPRTPRASYR